MPNHDPLPVSPSSARTPGSIASLASVPEPSHVVKFDVENTRECCLGTGENFAGIWGARDTWRHYEGCAKAKGADVGNAISVARIGFGELYIVEPSAQVWLVQALGIIDFPSLRNNRDGTPVMRSMVAVQAGSDQLRGDGGADVGSIYHAPLPSVANPDVPREPVDLAANEAQRTAYMTDPAVGFQMIPTTACRCTSGSFRTPVGKGGAGRAAGGGHGRGDGGRGRGRGDRPPAQPPAGPAVAELTSQLAKTKRELATASRKFDGPSKKEETTARYNRD